MKEKLHRKLVFYVIKSRTVDIKKWLKICEVKSVEQFLSSKKFFNDVHRWKSVLEDHGDVFAAALVYHKKCMICCMVNVQRDLCLAINHEELILNESVTAVS